MKNEKARHERRGAKSAPKLGIIAGGGSAPRFLIDACQKLGRDFFVICLEGQADKDLAEGLPHAWLPLGAGAKLKTVAEEQGLKEAVMIGSVRRPSITELKPDWLALKVVMKAGINMAGDDAFLRAIGKAIEDESGMRVIGAQEIFTDLLTPEGPAWAKSSMPMRRTISPAASTSPARLARSISASR